MNIDRKLLVDLFLKFVSYDTTSDPESKTVPSTQRQMDFAKILAEDCKNLGLSDVKVHDAGYVTLTLPSNIDRKVPTVGFMAHHDTVNAASGENIKPQIIENYDGKDIKLGDSLILSPKEFVSLNKYIGQDLITTDGTTLLGADDKAGIAEILAALVYLMNNPEIKHGDVRVAFNQDEEIGTGMDHFDAKDFAADFAYTIDGGELGEFTYETFNAAKAKITITGKSVHPGSAKGLMVNAGLLAAEFIQSFPENETPATTEGYQGYYHINGGSMSCEKAVLDYMIRDFDKAKFEERKQYLTNKVAEFNQKYDGAFKMVMQDQYYNMLEVLKNKPEVLELAQKAMKEVGVTPNVVPIRGGTDGSKLSFMGTPCPNIFTGGHNFHGPYEYVCIQSMIKASETIVKIIELVEKTN